MELKIARMHFIEVRRRGPPHCRSSRRIITEFPILPYSCTGA
jgi:hypothetical protein